jgi:hypothetical protein
MIYKFQNDRQDRVFASNNLGDEMNENTVEDIEILKCERSNLIDSLSELLHVINMMAPKLKDTAGYLQAKNSLEKIS